MQLKPNLLHEILDQDFLAAVQSKEFASEVPVQEIFDEEFI